MMKDNISNSGGLSSWYLLLLSSQPSLKKNTFLSGDLFVLYNVILWNISFPG